MSPRWHDRGLTNSAKLVEEGLDVNSKQLSITEIQFLCPRTNLLLDVRVPSDVDSLAKAWGGEVHISCPRCGRDHDFKMREAYLEHVLRAARFDVSMSR
jgi:hypothetical protein